MAFVIKTPKSLLDNMDPWCIDTHGKTGLTAACLRDDALTMRDAEERMCHFVQKHFADKGRVLLAGSSVHVDKGFLRKFVFAARFHCWMRIEIDFYIVYKKGHAQTACASSLSYLRCV